MRQQEAGAHTSPNAFITPDRRILVAEIMMPIIVKIDLFIDFLGIFESLKHRIHMSILGCFFSVANKSLRPTDLALQFHLHPALV